MSQVYPLDSLIRRLDPSSLPDRLDPEERLVLFDAKARKVLPKKPIFSLGRDLRYFLVSVRRRPVEGGGPVCKLKSRTTRSSIEVEVCYEAHCEPGREEQLVTALHHGEHPAAVLDQILAGYVQDFAAEPANIHRDLCVEFQELEAELRAYLSRRAAREVGLVLEVELRSQLEAKLKPIPLKTGFFPVRVRDYDQEIELKLTTELDIYPQHKMRAMLCYNQTLELEEVIKQTVRQTLAREVTLHTFCYRLASQVREVLTAALDQRLQQEGRRTSFLRLESPLLGSLPSEHVEVSPHVVECPIQDCDTPIKVEHRVKLCLQDLGRYRASGIQNLEEWVQKKLDIITRDVLFDKRYIDLLVDFRSEEIKIPMERLSEEIGYTVKQLVTIPNLEPLTWKDGISIDNTEDTYETHDSRVHVGLNVVVRGKIVRLRETALSRYLTPGSKILSDMRETVKREVQQLMHSIEPERFYMRFQFSDRPDERPVRELLEERITAVLAERFVLEDAVVVAKPLQTELTELLMKLQQGPHQLEVTCFPLNGGGDEVHYRIDFDVVGVDPNGWYTLWSKSAQSAEELLDKMREVMKQVIQSKINTASNQMRQYTELGHQRRVEEVIYQLTRLKVVEVFGLVISVVNVHRSATPTEVSGKTAEEYAARQALEAGQIVLNSKVEELRMLEAKKAELIQSGVEIDDPVLTSVEDRIKTLTEDLSPAQFDRGRQRITDLLTEATGTPSADDWMRLVLEQPAYRKQLSGEAEETPR